MMERRGSPHSMGTINLFDADSLSRQDQIQADLGWDLESGIPWNLTVDFSKPLLPLDTDALVFPGASREQRLVLSQYLGLVINSTIAEMEGVIHQLKDSAWQKWMDEFPVNPEMRQLGERFFEEEAKHSLAFERYNEKFVSELALPSEVLSRLMPKAFGSWFLKAIELNARAGGAAFWWVVSAVEEVSIEIYRQMHAHEKNLEPLFFQLHRRHLEDEARHRNYAFLMLELGAKRPHGMARSMLWQTDLLWAQGWTTAWVVAELTRLYEVKKMKSDHEWLRTLQSCLPLMKPLGAVEILKRFLFSAPYVSHVLNPHHHRHTTKLAVKQKVWRFPWPKPRVPSTGEGF
jgi:predicted metal-dependent hydrolase